MQQLNRLKIDLLISIILISIYMTGFYNYLPAPIQLLSIKILIVSIALIHAHMSRKLLLPSVDWNKEGLNAKTVLVIALYIAFIFAYSQAG
jgi:hypothetical protein